MARERRRNSEGPFPEPDTLPMMNIILMLILALVTMSAMLPLGFLSSESQRLSKGPGAAPEKAEEKKPLNLIVFITDAGFNVSVYGAVKMGEADPANPQRKQPLVPNLLGPDGAPTVPNYPALQEKLSEFKKLDAAEQSMTITADPQIKFDAIIQTMDWSRFDKEKGILFPKVSFAAGIVG